MLVLRRYQIKMNYNLACLLKKEFLRDTNTQAKNDKMLKNTTAKELTKP